MFPVDGTTLLPVWMNGMNLVKSEKFVARLQELTGKEKDVIRYHLLTSQLSPEYASHYYKADDGEVIYLASQIGLSPSTALDQAQQGGTGIVTGLDWFNQLNERRRIRLLYFVKNAYEKQNDDQALEIINRLPVEVSFLESLKVAKAKEFNRLAYKLVYGYDPGN
ncbi:hypothetical protein CBS101457_003029 [Exobasidium rhododendri]|nr:hypothetical protein CBS101457_003029 [Exobasidium rhododendri]